MLVRVDHIALPNLVAGGRIVPELVQGACTASAIAGQIATFLDDPSQAEALRSGLGDVRDRLCGDGAFDRAAVAVLEEVGIRPV
jgi:lipid-A-disaccharide synthase